jgi:hypothetical protein
VSIFFPPDGAHFFAGDTIHFAAEGSGLSHPTDPPSSIELVWTSSRDGFIGEGPRLDRNDLSVASHRITLRANGSVGSAEDAITIYVDPKP